ETSLSDSSLASSAVWPGAEDSPPSVRVSSSRPARSPFRRRVRSRSRVLNSLSSVFVIVPVCNLPPLERRPAAFGLDALLLEHLDQFLPVSADRGRRVAPDLPRDGAGASLRLGDPFREGLDQFPRVLPLRGIRIFFQTVHALPELVQL